MLYKRDIFLEIEKIIDRDEFIILVGARQTGKTSMLIMLKEFLDNNGKESYYFNLENQDYLNILNKHPFNIFDIIPKSKIKQTIFVDEIQYLDNPTNFLKLLYDEKRDKIKIIASGSSSFYIDKKFKDSLAGRKFLFEIYPLNFNEYLTFNQKDELLKQKSQKLSVYYKKELLDLWEQYLIYGGYPQVALAKDSEIKKILLEEIGASYIKKDVTEAGVKNTEKYFALLKILANQTGQLVNSQELANILQISHKTVEEYLYVMRKSYQIALIKPFYRNIRKELTKMPKIYFYDLGLRNVFLNNYSSISGRSDKGAYLENIFFKEFLNQTKNIDQIKFWRTQDKNEVDFVINNEAFEVKFEIKQGAEKKYEKFKELYPDIKFSFLGRNNILQKFYQWQTDKISKL